MPYYVGFRGSVRREPRNITMPRRTLIKRNSSAKPAFEVAKKGGRGAAVAPLS
jgi:hypothetical protein